MLNCPLRERLMSITFDLPDSIERSLRQELGNLNQAAKEAALVELYRQEKLTHYELSQALGLDRLETETILKKHNVTEDLLTNEQYNMALSRLLAMTNT
jgi:predicted HTH domain antitoxin